MTEKPKEFDMREVNMAIAVYRQMFDQNKKLFSGEDLSYNTFGYKKDVLNPLQVLLADNTGKIWRTGDLTQLGHKFDAFRSGLSKDILRNKGQVDSYKLLLNAAFDCGFGQAFKLLLEKMKERARENYH